MQTAYSARGYFHVNFFWLKCYAITVDMVQKKFFGKVWALIGPKEGSNTIFPYFALVSQGLQKNFGKSKNCF